MSSPAETLHSILSYIGGNAVSEYSDNAQLLTYLEWLAPQSNDLQNARNQRNAAHRRIVELQAHIAELEAVINKVYRATERTAPFVKADEFNRLNIAAICAGYITSPEKASE